MLASYEQDEDNLPQGLAQSKTSNSLQNQTPNNTNTNISKNPDKALSPKQLQGCSLRVSKARANVWLLVRSLREVTQSEAWRTIGNRMVRHCKRTLEGWRWFWGWGYYGQWLSLRFLRCLIVMNDGFSSLELEKRCASTEEVRYYQSWEHNGSHLRQSVALPAFFCSNLANGVYDVNSRLWGMS